MERKELAREIASIMRANSAAIAERLEREFVREYPEASANTMSAEAIHQWTIGDIENTARSLEQDDVDSMVYLFGLGGDSVRDPQNPELTRFATRVSDILFTTRHIAPFLYSAAQPDRAHTRELIDCFEDFVQRSIARNCEAFALEIGRKGAVSRNWNPMSFMEPGSGEATPLELHADMLDTSASGCGSSARYGLEIPLTSREEEVLRLVLEGHSNGEIASSLGIQQNTVKNHVASIFGKCGVRSRVELLAKLAGR